MIKIKTSLFQNDSLALEGNQAPSEMNTFQHTSGKKQLNQSLINLDWLSSQPLLPFIVPVLPTHLLYRSLISQGLEDSLEIVEWIRGEQLQKILDFDIWEESSERNTQDISFSKALSWLQLWLAISPEFAAERFLELSEETICLILSKLFEILPEGVTYISDEVRENWWLTPDRRFFIQIRENVEESFEILKPFVDALYGKNVKLAGSVFAYSCMLVRDETLEAGQRWRSMRLADQGFVEPEEARRTLSPKSSMELKKYIQDAKKIEAERTEAHKKLSHTIFHDLEEKPSQEFSPEEFDNIVKLLAEFEPEEGVRFMQLALGQQKVKALVGNTNVDPEKFYDDEDFINEAAEEILVTTKNILLHLEFQQSQQGEPRLLVEKALLHMAKENKNTLSLTKSALAYLANCVLSGTQTQFSNSALENALHVTRGAVNIGLELCLKMPKEYGLELPHQNEIENAAFSIESVGVNFLFHLGWNILFKIEEKLADKLIDLDTNHIQFQGKLKTTRTVTLTDHSSLDVSLTKLVENLRFADITKWLSSCESLFSNEIFFTFKSLFHRVPQYPRTLDGVSLTHVSQDTKPFETLREVNKCFDFVQNLTQNLTHFES